MATDTNRKLIPFTGEHFAEFCRKMVGQPYWYGGCVYKCTNSLLTRKTAQYPSHYGSSRTSRYKQDIAAKKVCADCIGGVKGYCWTNGGQGVLESIGTDKTFSSVYGSNGCPDKGADSMFAYAKGKGAKWGAIGSIPEVVGLAVHKSGHVGYYVGNGEVVEWKGFSHGCVKTRLSDASWTYWYQLPFINYGAVPGEAPDTTAPADTTAPVGTTTPTVRNLYYKSGSTMLRGEDVRLLQVDLTTLGYDCGTADGIFGPKTKAAVVAFQRDHKLEVDGIVGEKTRAALEKALTRLDVPQAQKPADEHHEGQTEVGGGSEVGSDPEDGEGPEGAVTPPTDSDEGNATEDDDEDYTVPSADVSLNFGTRLLQYRAGYTMMTGDDVAAVQTALIRLGYAPGKADGIFGPNTQSAVEAFQRHTGIAVDGIVGPDTRKALTDALASATNAPISPQEDENCAPVTIRIQMEREANIAQFGSGVVEMDIEEYLRGVVPSEMFESADPEALKAQAICARTYAYRRRGSVLSDTTKHQAFHASKIGSSPRSDAAIAATKGQVLMYNGKIIDCFYCASNKGVTKRSGDVWSTHYPYYVSKPDEWDEAARVERAVTSFGHGIGLSQHGAMWAAKHGVRCESILAFYYEGAKICAGYGVAK